MKLTISPRRCYRFSVSDKVQLFWSRIHTLGQGVWLNSRALT